MKFKVVSIEGDESAKKYTCEFTNGEETKSFFTWIGLPEINSPMSVLQILAANCAAEFGGDGSIIAGSKKFTENTEVNIDFDYEV